MTDPRTVIEAFQGVARVEIRRAASADSCILSTRVACEVFGRFALEARPLVVEAFIFNRAFLEAVDREGRWPQGEDEVRAWSERHGAWSVGLGRRDRPPSGPGKWPGHLVATVEDRWLVDASIDQASRPVHDIELPGVLVQPAGPAFFAGQESLDVYSDTYGLLVVYRAHPGDSDYEAAPDWQRETRSRRVADRIERRMRSALG